MSSPELDQFLSLSQILTGESDLNQELAAQYLQRLKDKYPTQMQNILTAFGKIAADEHAVFEVKRRIVGDSNLQPLAQQIISVWYTSEFVGPDGKTNGGTQAQYYHGLLWKVILAHAPTDSKQDYGYWAKAPNAEKTRKQRGKKP